MLVYTLFGGIVSFENMFEARAGSFSIWKVNSVACIFLFFCVESSIRVVISSRLTEDACDETCDDGNEKDDEQQGKLVALDVFFSKKITI